MTWRESASARSIRQRDSTWFWMGSNECKVFYWRSVETDGDSEALGARSQYNDAIVNIFTRLNTAGRTLTREDITFAWLKIGWKSEHTDGKGATACLEALKARVADLDLNVAMDDLVSAISFVWAVAFNDGKLLNNDDLMKGEAIRPMAALVSEHWHVVTEAVATVSTHVRDRGLRFRNHYQSVNALAYLWAWYFLALRFAHDRKLNVRENDALEKRAADSLDGIVDRWLFCSQWAGVWASSSARNLAAMAKDLAICGKGVESLVDSESVILLLAKHMQAELEGLQTDAVAGIARLAADDRSEVRQYYTALWVWNRLDESRWVKAKLALREGGRRATRIEVDHVVAFEMWRTTVGSLRKLEQIPVAELDDLELRVNELGNCMLLEKNFNISKGKGSLKAFLDGVRKIKDSVVTIDDWAKGMELDMMLVDSSHADLLALDRLIVERTQRIRSDLEQFVRGTKRRVDV